MRDRSGAIDPLIASFEPARWPAIVAEYLPAWSRALVLAGCAVSAVVAAKALLGALVPLASAVWRRHAGAEPSLRGVRMLALGAALLLAAAGLALAPAIA